MSQIPNVFNALSKLNLLKIAILLLDKFNLLTFLNPFILCRNGDGGMEMEKNGFYFSGNIKV